MTLLLNVDDAVVTNDLALTGNPAVRISGANVQFTNASGGRLTGADGAAAALTIEAAGSTITNAAGGEIAAATGGIAIQGSSGADKVIDAGSIRGLVNLGGGADIFEAQRSYADAGAVDLGEGDDIFRHTNGASESVRAVAGGDGFDRVVLADTGNYINGSAVTGFEQLEVGGVKAGSANRAVNLLGFSGFTHIVVTAGTHLNLSGSDNPLANISFVGDAIAYTDLSVGGGSVFSSITGSDGREIVSIRVATISGAVQLGGGDDAFRYEAFSYTTAPVLGGIVDGGSGTDTLGLFVDDGRTVDVGAFVNFERLDAGRFTSGTTVVRVVNADGFSAIDVDSLGKLTLADSNSPNAVVSMGSFGSGLVLESTAIVGQVGTPQSAAVQFVDTSSPLSITNDGSVLGNVHLGYGADAYEGTGTVGGSVYGYSGDDRLSGAGGHDSLHGGHGADVLDGGAGPDEMAGGAGDDRYFVDDPGDKLSESSGAGDDTVFASISFILAPGLETLVLEGPAALDGRGNGDANVLIGNDEANRLDGGANADSMTGGNGDDTYVVDNAQDEVIELADGGIDTIESSVNYSLGEHLEHLSLSGGAVTGTGNGGDNEIAGNSLGNRLFGGGGSDRISGGAGNDLIDGQAGADEMSGGKGNDTYVVNDLGDAVVEAADAGIDTVKTNLSFTLASQLENLTLTGSANVSGIGNAAGNRIVGNAGNNLLEGKGGADFLDGMKGADQMKGGTGADVYVVDNVGDKVVELSGGGIDTVHSTISYKLGAGVENLTLIGRASIAGTGNALANQLTGNAAANRLDGGDGGDRISGSLGADQLHGGKGLDVMDGGAGADRLYGGTGNDQLTGGSGPDGFYFDTAPNAKTNADKIVDFRAKDDTIFLDGDIFAALSDGVLQVGAFAQGRRATEADDRIVFDQSTGKIFYDPDGAGGAAAVLFAQVTPGITLTHADFVIYG